VSQREQYRDDDYLNGAKEQAYLTQHESIENDNERS
jgi:hypothetical protein